MANCKAYREQDTMVCGLCGLSWGVDDPDRPECNPVKPALPMGIAPRIRSLIRRHNLRGKS